MKPSPRLNILIIHQSAELYGSDVTLLTFLKNSSDDSLQYTVVIPNEGPLLNELLKLPAVKVIVAPILKVMRKDASVTGILNLVKRALTQFKTYKKIGVTHYDLVYSNTLAILDGVLIRTAYRKSHIWHVHEIITHPRIANIGYKILLKLFSTHILYNSHATHRAMAPGVKTSKETIVYNGSEPVQKTRNPKDVLRLAVVGRLSSLKGQHLLIDAISKLSLESQRKVELNFFGAPIDGDQSTLQNLKSLLSSPQIVCSYNFWGFVADKADIYSNADVIIVPSTQPESFGMVILEAWSCSLPVIAAAHGAPSEIINDRKTGLLFKPNSSVDLAHKIDELLINPHLASTLAKNGHSAYQSKFSLSNYVLLLENTIKSVAT